MKTPFDRILDTPHFNDHIDTPHLFGESDRLPGPDGTPGKGLKITEAVPLAELWWERVRFQMPDFNKPAEQQIIKSGIMMGLPWFNLDKQEKLRVLAQWYAHVGVHTIIEGKSTSQDGKLEILDTLREKGKAILPVLDDRGTHGKVTDKLETETWKKGYEEIQQADKPLVDTKGEQLKPKEESDVQEKTATAESAGE